MKKTQRRTLHDGYNCWRSKRERERVTFLNNKNVVTKVVALFVMNSKKVLKD